MFGTSLVHQVAFHCLVSMRRWKLSCQEWREQGKSARWLITGNKVSRTSDCHKCQVLISNRVSSNLKGVTRTLSVPHKTKYSQQHSFLGSHLALSVPRVPWSCHRCLESVYGISTWCYWNYTICISAAILFWLSELETRFWCSVDGINQVTCRSKLWCHWPLVPWLQATLSRACPSSRC